MSAFLACALLIGFRLLPLLVVAPVMAFRRLPVLARLALTLILAAVFAGATAATPTNPIAAGWGVLISEFVLGSALAFGFHAAIGAVHAMGNMLDQQSGLAAAAVFDPNTSQSSSLIAELLTMASLTGFLALDGHHALLRGFSSFLVAVPPGQQVLPDASLLSGLGEQFAFAFILTAPVMVTVWLVDLAVALISRSAPQANIYFVAVPIKLIVGLLALAWLCQAILPSLQSMLSTASLPRGI